VVHAEDIIPCLAGPYTIRCPLLLTMDIDDILRQVDPPSRGLALETRDLQALTRLWVAERSAPELLLYVDLGI
jgi:hypothetical protein